MPLKINELKPGDIIQYDGVPELYLYEVLSIDMRDVNVYSILLPKYEREAHLHKRGTYSTRFIENHWTKISL